LCAVDGDGLNELVVAHTDRIVRAYRWWSSDDASAASKNHTTGTLVAVDRWHLTGQVTYTLPLIMRLHVTNSDLTQLC